MNAYRFNLPAGAHPGTDSRRAAELRAHLRRLAAALNPRWTPTGERDDFGTALLEIAARLAAETTQRLDRTAERDAMAFFDFLGLPPPPPRAAAGLLVIALTDDRLVESQAPARTRVTAGPAVLETAQALRVVPGRIAEVVTVDPAEDRIEPGPGQAVSLEPPAPVLEHRVRTFAAAGSRTVQVSPADGLAPGDLVRIGAAAHRVASVDDELVTLDDPLETPAAAGTIVARIVSLESFTLRDRQRHTFAVGHKELLNLEQPARITLGLQPSGLARELTRLDIAYAMFGTRDDEDEPRWHDLDLRGTAGPALLLDKTWTGTVDETEFNGRKSRWLRAELRTFLGRRVSPTSAASQVRIGVASLPPAGSAVTEGSETIAQAMHNGTPLSTARRFFPFGPEPLRFDVFALAAPEALSKTGAGVILDITVADASLTSFEVALGPDATTVGGYGAGRNGYLEVLSLDGTRGFRWHELEARNRSGERLLLAAAPVGVGVDATSDVVIIHDQADRSWGGRIRRPGSGTPAVLELLGWHPLLKLPGARVPNRPTVLPAPAGIPGVSVLLFSTAAGVPHTLQVGDFGEPSPAGWQPVRLDGLEAPDFGGAWTAVAVQGVGWPRRTPGTRLEIIVVDRAAAVWLGTAIVVRGEALTVRWEPLHGDVPADPGVRPAATRFPLGGASPLWVAYATPDSVHGLVRTGEETRPVPLGGRVAPGSALHSHPAVLGADRHPVTLGLSPDPSEAQLWLGLGRVRRVPLTGNVAGTRPFLMEREAGSPEIVVAGDGERLLRAPAELAVVGFRLHDHVQLDDDRVPHHVEVTTEPDNPAASRLAVLNDLNRRIKRDNLRVYQVNGIVAGATLRFLRETAKKDTVFAGAVDAADRTLLTLDPADAVTTATMRLIIGEASYRIRAIRPGARIAELEPEVIGADPAPGYRPAILLGEDVVAAADLKTLAELDTRTVPADAALHFGAPADPERQELGLRQPNGATVWALLTGRWDTAPPDGRAIVDGGLPWRPSWSEDAFQRGFSNPELSWEYFDGRGWRALEDGFSDLTRNLSASGTVAFVVPPDLTPTDIGGRPDLWIRARLVGGDYGRPAYIVREEPITGGTQQTVIVDTSALHPPEILAIEASFTMAGSTAPEIVLVENNLDVRDETQAAATTGARFAVFQSVTAIDPEASERAVLLGLTSPTGRGTVTVLADAADRDGGGSLRAELRTADGWRRVAVDDQTRALRRRGLITLSFDRDPVRTRLFGLDRVWLRLRPEPGADALWAPVVHRLAVNAVPVSHARTVRNELIGSSSGEPGLTVRLAETPVLPDSVELRVREELGDDDRTGLQVEEPADFPGTWVLWQRADSLLAHDGAARVYLLEPATGRIRFGDGRTGRIPAAGRDNIRCFRYQQGGGPDGNLAAWTPARPASTVDGLDTVVLPVGTAGGFAAPPADALFASAPDRLRHAGRALTATDIEALAVTSSAEVVRAHCAGPRGPGDPIRITIAVRGDGLCPQPTFTQRDAVAAAIRAAGWGGLAEADLEVTGPEYVRVAVSAHLVAAAELLAGVETAARSSLAGLLDPVEGWPFGRRPSPADLLRVLVDIPGVDRVAGVEVSSPGGRPLPPIPAGGLICADPADIAVTVTVEETA